MPTLQEVVQARIRGVTYTNGQWNEDWHALFDLEGVPVGQWAERLIAYATAFGLPASTAAAALNNFLLNPTQINDGTTTGPSLDLNFVAMDTSYTTGASLNLVLTSSGQGTYQWWEQPTSQGTYQVWTGYDQWEPSINLDFISQRYQVKG